MSVVIKVRDEIAAIKDGEWQAKDEMLLMLLSTFGHEDIEGYSPFPDYTVAEMATEAIGGEIIKVIDPPRFVKDRVY